MDIDVSTVKAVYGTDNADEVVAKKSAGRQERVFSAPKVSRVNMDEAMCRKLCEKIGLEYMSGYEGRVLQYRLTDETVDRYGDIVVAKGGDFTNYMKNPVVMTFHDYNQFPVGNSLRVWHDKEKKAVCSWILFFDDRVDRTGMADTAYKFASSGAMKAGSIGFMPTETRKPSDVERAQLGMGAYGVIFDKWELMEFSVCPVPANPSALQDSIKRGMYSKDKLAENNRLFTRDQFDELLCAIDKLTINAAHKDGEPAPDAPVVEPEPVVSDEPAPAPDAPEPPAPVLDTVKVLIDTKEAVDLKF